MAFAKLRTIRLSSEGHIHFGLCAFLVFTYLLQIVVLKKKLTTFDRYLGYLNKFLVLSQLLVQSQLFEGSFLYLALFTIKCMPAVHFDIPILGFIQWILMIKHKRNGVGEFLMIKKLKSSGNWKED